MLAYLSRLILFLIAVSVIRSAAGFLQRLWYGTRAPQSSPRQAPPQSQSTLLKQDPVCGAYVASDSSLKRIVSGQVLHFCSPECRDRYVA